MPTLYEASGLTQAPTATADKPYAGLWNAGTTRPVIRVREIGFSNTAATAGKIAIKRTSARGTQTATQAGTPLDSGDAAAGGTLDLTYSADPTVTGNYLRRYHYPATIGAGAVLSWWTTPGGLEVPVGAGIALVVPTAVAGIALELWVVWEEG